MYAKLNYRIIIEITKEVYLNFIVFCKFKQIFSRIKLAMQNIDSRKILAVTTNTGIMACLNEYEM